MDLMLGLFSVLGEGSEKESEVIFQAVAEACEWLEEHFGQKWPARVTWGQLHLLTLTSPMNTVP